MKEEFDAKVFIERDNGGKTGELQIMCKPPFDKGLFTSVTFGLKFVEPFFEADRPSGEWEELDSMVAKAKCSVCGGVTLTDLGESNFCPNCGAKMVEKKKDCFFMDESCRDNPCGDCPYLKGGDEK